MRNPSRKHKDYGKIKQYWPAYSTWRSAHDKGMADEYCKGKFGHAFCPTKDDEESPLLAYLDNVYKASR